MRRRWACLSFGVAIAVVLALVSGTADALPNKKVDLIRGQGSDTTVDVQQDLDRAFNNTIGCSVVDGAGVPLPDMGCFGPNVGPPFGPENWDHDVALTYFALGSGNGVNQLLHQGESGYATIEYARSSSGRGTAPATMKFVAFAKDAIPWINFRTGTTAEEAGPAAGVDTMSKTNLTDIFVNCTITKWSSASLVDPGTHVGQADDDIIVWAAQAGSGTRKSFDGASFVGGDSANCIPAVNKDNDASNGGERVIFEHDPTPIRSCAIDPPGSALPACPAGGDVQSIHYMGFAAYTVFPVNPTYGKAMGADLGCIGNTNPGVCPSALTIGNGTYIFSRFVHNVYRNSFPSDNITPAALDFVGEKGWMCKGNSTEAVAGTDTDSRGGHITNPKTGVNYQTEIADIMIRDGMGPLPFGPIGGGVSGNSRCQLK